MEEKDLYKSKGTSSDDQKCANRQNLKDLFSNENCPDQDDYALIFDSTINLKDDGILRPDGEGNPLTIKGNKIKGEEGKQNVLKFALNGEEPLCESDNELGWLIQLKDIGFGKSNLCFSKINSHRKESEPILCFNSDGDINVSKDIKLGGDIKIDSNKFGWIIKESISPMPNQLNAKKGTSIIFKDNYLFVGFPGQGRVFRSRYNNNNEFEKLELFIDEELDFSSLMASSSWGTPYGIVCAKENGNVYLYSNFILKVRQEIKNYDPKISLLNSLDLNPHYFSIGYTESSSKRGYVDIFKVGSITENRQKLNPKGNGTNFGCSISSYYPYLLIGESNLNSKGSISFYEEEKVIKDGEEIYEFVHKKTYPDSNIGNEEINLQNNSKFGYSVNINFPYAIIGVPGHNNNRGAAYLFKKENENWTKVGWIFAENSKKGDSFGASAKIITESKIVIGAPGKNSGVGAIYFFENLANNEGEKWKLTQCLNGENSIAGSVFNETYTIEEDNGDKNGGNFGETIEVINDFTIVVGAPNQNFGRGEVFVVMEISELKTYLKSIQSNVNIF